MSQKEEVQESLDRLGFQLGEIVETIVTSRSLGGELNAAPMGVTRKGPRTIDVKPFLDTTTYKNLRDTAKGMANISYDVRLFLETAFKEGSVNPDWFEGREGFPHLRGADAFLFFSVIDETRVSEGRACLTCQVEWVKVLTVSPKVFSRGFAAAIEAVIHATRIEIFIREGKRDEVEKRLQRFEACRETVERVSPEGSPNRWVMKTLEERIRAWR